MGKTATAESETTDKGGTTVLAKTCHILQLVAYISAGSLVCVLGARPVSMPPSPTHASLGWGGGCKAGPQVPCSLGRRSVGRILLPGCVGFLLGFGLGTNENAFFGMGVIGRQ